MTEPPELNAREARQGQRIPMVRRVLVLSLAAAAIGLAAAAVFLIP